MASERLEIDAKSLWMKAEFQIEIDRTAGLVHLTLSGFFMPGDVASLGSAIRCEYPKLGCAANDHRTLLDLRAMAIQSQETLGVFARLLNDPTYQAQRLAIVFAHTLVRMQVSRVAAHRDGTRFFDDIGDAQRWIVEDRSLAA